jgi:hypothetical protein
MRAVNLCDMHTFSAGRGKKTQSAGLDTAPWRFDASMRASDAGVTGGTPAGDQA